MSINRKMARQHLDAKFAEIKNLKILIPPPKGWIKAIRNALGMTTIQLAKRLNISQSRVTSIEKDETLGKLKLGTLESVAEALGCRFLYALVPVNDLDSMVYEQAKKRAKILLSQAKHTMKLENQASGINDEDDMETLIQELLKGSQSKLWDED